jgi:hypothetical protein
MTTDRAARLTTIVIVLALAALGLARPAAVLSGGAAWIAFLFFACSGWGWLVTLALRIEDPDFGLRAVWGIAGYLAVAGVFLAIGMCSRPVILGLLALGATGFAWREWVTPAPLWQLARDAARAARARPVVAFAVVVIGALAVAQIVGAIVRLDRSPWDDDIAYTPFAKRLLDTGNLVEPFSFRRLAAYGGHIALEALAGARGTLVSIHLVDKGLCFGLVMLLMVGYARELGRVAAVWLGVVVLVVIAVPDISVNTASYWSGAVVFLALYRSVVRGELVAAALVAAAACTLRPTYMPVVMLFLALTLWRARAGRRMWWRVIAVGAAALVPWCMAAFVSNRTFLFPFWQGTFNHGLVLGPAGWTWVDELSLLFSSLIEAQPIVVAMLVVPLVAFCDDDRPSRPLHALLFASVAAFLLLVHSFADADPLSMWRYAFGYALPLLVAFALEIGVEAEPPGARLPPLGRWVLLAALLVQLVWSRGALAKQVTMIGRDVREAIAIDDRGNPNARAEARRYAAMQAAVPAGERLFVMLDDPEFLDFARNRIANIDMPGYASPGPQLPAFAGPEALRSYLLDEGYRYVAFVREERSRFVFRRAFWVWRLFNDTEFFQAMSAYTIDAIDSLALLATTTRVLYDDDGLVVLDLDGPHAPAPRLDPARERERRDEYVRDLAHREHLEREWGLTTRRDLVFADGFSGVVFAQAEDDAHWYDFVIHNPKPTRGVPVRWMQRRVHLRVRGNGRMHLVMRGHFNLHAMYTRPRLDVSLDGELLASVTAGGDGVFAIDLDVVPPSGWGDLYIVLDAASQPERDVRDLRLAGLEEVVWDPR